MIKVLIINDSITIQEHMKRIINADSGCKLIGVASDGFEGFDLVNSMCPDVILMDIHMPRCDGMQATAKIMKFRPTPLIIVTATITKHMSRIYDCMANGALEVVKTPVTVDEGHNLINRIKIANSLKPRVVKTEKIALADGDRSFKSRVGTSLKTSAARKIIAIGASTGGPNAVVTVLKDLPPDLNAAVIIVQHIGAEFAPSLADWLDTNCRLRVKPAQDDERIINGTGLLAGRNENLVVERGYTVKYREAPPSAICVPSIDVTFKSIAEIYGPHAIGVILTGMGTDGAMGLKAIRDAGGRTIAQDEESSLIYGMPKAAAQLGAAEFILPSNKIAGQIMKLLQ